MTYQSEVLADTPLMYARLGGINAATVGTDSSGNNRNAESVIGAPTYAQPSLLVSDTADLSCGFATSGLQWTVLSWLNQGSYTLEAWINCTNIGGSQTPIIWERDVSGSRIFQFRIESTGKLGLILWTAGGGPYINAGTKILAKNTVYHVVATYAAATGSAKTYVDGALDGNWTVPISPAMTGSAPMKLACGFGGGFTYAGTAYFAGRVDDAAYYGTALSAARVLAHYNAGIAAPPPANDAWVWNGTTAVPANMTVWTGTAETAASVSVA